MTRHELPSFCEPVVAQRYFTYTTFLNSFEKLLGQFETELYDFTSIGESVNNNPIYRLAIGTGKTKVLMWSQMHGNESTTTRSLFYLVDWFLKSDLLEKYQLYIIPVLNPDGLNQWTRVNANGVDLNRDAQDLSQPESLILRSAFDSFKPNFCLNLHDQRTIYGSPDGLKAVQCSFLSPAANEARDITPSRLAAMEVINSIVNNVKDDVKGAIGRYDDGYNINCVGDTFQSLGVPTILFEAGQSDTDYYRLSTVNVIFQALKAALHSITAENKNKKEEIISTYKEINPIATNFTDILIKNVPSGKKRVDLSIMYQEILQDDQLFFSPILSGINDSSVKNAHRFIDFCSTENTMDFEVSKGQRFISNSLGIDIFY